MPYHSGTDLAQLLERLVRRAGRRATLVEAGRSVEGRPIQAATIAAPGRIPDATRSQALVTANIHGVEVVGSEVAMAIASRLSAPSPYGAAAELLGLCDVTVVPVANPDARESAMSAKNRGGCITLAPRRNARGVDLNRNFPYPPDRRDPWNPLSGTKVAYTPWYRGPAPLSEPEAAALEALAQRLEPFAAASLHSAGRLFLYPFSWTEEPCRHASAFLAMGAAFRSRQRLVPYELRQAAGWYPILGDLDDHLYENHGCLAFTVEVGQLAAAVRACPSLAGQAFWWANPRSPEPAISDVVEATLAALAEGHHQSGGRPVTGAGVARDDDE